MLRVLIISAFLALSAGCISTPPKADTPIEQVAVAAATVEGVANSVREAYMAGRISKERAIEFMDILKDAQTLIESAETALTAGDVATAEGQLTIALSLLTTIELALAEDSNV